MSAQVIHIEDTISFAAKEATKLVNIGFCSKIADAIEYLYAKRTLAFKAKIMEKCEDDFISDIRTLGSR